MFEGLVNLAEYLRKSGVTLPGEKKLDGHSQYTQGQPGNDQSQPIGQTDSGQPLQAVGRGTHSIPEWGDVMVAKTAPGHEQTAPKHLEHDGKHWVRAGFNSEDNTIGYHEYQPNRHVMDPQAGFAREAIPIQTKSVSGGVFQVAGLPQSAGGDLPDTINDPNHGLLTIRGYNQDSQTTTYHKDVHNPGWKQQPTESEVGNQNNTSMAPHGALPGKTSPAAIPPPAAGQGQPNNRGNVVGAGVSNGSSPQPGKPGIKPIFGKPGIEQGKPEGNPVQSNQGMKPIFGAPAPNPGMGAQSAAPMPSKPVQSGVPNVPQQGQQAAPAAKPAVPAMGGQLPIRRPGATQPGMTSQNTGRDNGQVKNPADVRPGNIAVRKSMVGLNALSDYLEKSAGEGSRGGHVIGHTSSGKPVYEAHDFSPDSPYGKQHSEHPGYPITMLPSQKFHETGFNEWSSKDHEEAGKLHAEQAKKLEAEYKQAKKGVGKDTGFFDRKAKEHNIVSDLDRKRTIVQNTRVAHMEAAKMVAKKDESKPATDYLEKSGEERPGHLYTRRTGTPGNYEYEYATYGHKSIGKEVTSRVLSNGSVLKFHINGNKFTATIDGKVVSSEGFGLQPAPKHNFGEQYTHKLSMGGNKAVLITKDEVDKVNSVIDANLASIDGLSKLKDAHNKLENYREERNRRFENEQQSSILKTPPKVDIEALEKEYPKAAVYLKAERYEQASNDEKSSAGREAKTLLLAGGSIESANRILDKWVGGEYWKELLPKEKEKEEDKVWSYNLDGTGPVLYPDKNHPERYITKPNPYLKPATEPVKVQEKTEGTRFTIPEQPNAEKQKETKRQKESRMAEDKYIKEMKAERQLAEKAERPEDKVRHYRVAADKADRAATLAKDRGDMNQSKELQKVVEENYKALQHWHYKVLDAAESSKPEFTVTQPEYKTGELDFGKSLPGLHALSDYLNKADLLPGGLAKDKSPNDFNPTQLAAGTKVEMEHTANRLIAREIAMDHLTEDPNYYKKLARMEAMNIMKKAHSESDVEGMIQDLFDKNPKPSDAEIHALATELGIEVTDLEEKVYGMMGQALKKALPGKGVEGGNKTPPKEYREGGATGKTDYADPANFKYPIDDEGHVRAAISYFSKPKNAGVYSEPEQKSIWARIRKAAKRFNIELGEQSGPPSVEKLKKSLYDEPCCEKDGVSIGAIPIKLFEGTPLMKDALELAKEEIDFEIWKEAKCKEFEVSWETRNKWDYVKKAKYDTVEDELRKVTKGKSQKLKEAILELKSKLLKYRIAQEKGESVKKSLTGSTMKTGLEMMADYLGKSDANPMPDDDCRLDYGRSNEMGGSPNGGDLGDGEPNSNASGGGATGERADVGSGIPMPVKTVSHATSNGIPADVGGNPKTAKSVSGVDGNGIPLDVGGNPKLAEKELSDDDRPIDEMMTDGHKILEGNMTEKSLTPANQRQMVAREHAAKVAELTRSHDIRVGRVESPYSFANPANSIDGITEGLCKSESFYADNNPPSLAQPGTPIRQHILCKSEGCQTQYPAFLTCCPSCGEGRVVNRLLPKTGFVGDQGTKLEKSMPLLHRHEEEADICIAGPSPVVYRTR